VHEKLHRDLDGTPQQQGVEHYFEPPVHVSLEAFLEKPRGNEKTRYNKKQRHPETIKTDIQYSQHGIIVQRQACIFQSFKAMPVAHENNANAPRIINPAQPGGAQNKLPVK
jgi:hypothetical protein